MTALIARSPLRSSRWRSALLASRIAAYASRGVCAYAYADNRHAHSAGIAAVDVGLDEESQLAAYLRVHYANEQDAVTLYPLAAFAAAARRTGQYSRSSYRGGRRYAFGRRAAVGAGGGATCVSSCEGR